MKAVYAMSAMNHTADACSAPASCAASMMKTLCAAAGTALVAVSFLRDVLLRRVALAVRIPLPCPAKP